MSFLGGLCHGSCRMTWLFMAEGAEFGGDSDIRVQVHGTSPPYTRSLLYLFYHFAPENTISHLSLQTLYTPSLPKPSFPHPPVHSCVPSIRPACLNPHCYAKWLTLPQGIGVTLGRSLTFRQHKLIITMAVAGIL